MLTETFVSIIRISFFVGFFFCKASSFLVEILGSTIGDYTFGGGLVFGIFLSMGIIFYFFQRGGKDMKELLSSKDAAHDMFISY